MITAQKEPCWIIASAAGYEHDVHFRDRTDCEEELGRCRREDPERYGASAPRKLAAPCWLVTCDGECEYTIDKEDEYVFHHDTAAEAQKTAQAYEWRRVPGAVPGDDRWYCPQDAPGDAEPLPTPPAAQEAAGQLVLPETVPS